MVAKFTRIGSPCPWFSSIVSGVQCVGVVGQSIGESWGITGCIMCVVYRLKV